MELVRGKKPENFSLTISYAVGRWIVFTRTPGLDGATGEGPSFAHAWHRQEPLWS
jgi:hypothetical protein